MDVEEPEVKIAVVALMWTLLQNGRQRKQVERLRHGRNIVHDPIVRRRGQQSLRWCVRPWLPSERRLRLVILILLTEELRIEDWESFRNFLGMEPTMFDELLNKLTRKKKRKTHFPSPLLSSSHDRYHMFTHAFCTVYVEYAINIFSNTYTTSGNMTITSQNARARCALQPRGFSKQKIVFDIA